ncbi:MAG: response regulator [Candidatus Azambacteria bacterium]|nr:response regulator [Candidatus Azambacteria bacterium]
MAKKILIVDDDEFMLGIYAKNFRDEEFEVFTAHDGEEAWNIIKSGNIPDVVFTGITMPKMTGFELIAKMQADERLAKIPVAINSHRGRPEDQNLAKEMNVDDFIVQGDTTPAEAVRRIKLLVGIQNKYKIAIVTDKYDALTLINLLNKQQGALCDPADKEIFLEIEPESERGLFKIRIDCKKVEKNEKF